MNLTVIGSSGTYPTPNNACSGYLFSSDGFNLQVDCGPGTFVEGQEYCSVEELDAVILTHWHPDHCTDIYPLFYALRFHPDTPSRLPVYAPAGAERHLFAFLSGDSREEFQRVFDFRVIDEESEFEAGPFKLRFARTHHPVETLAVSVQEGSRRVVYSSDTGPEGGYPELAAGADICICESTYEFAGQGPPIHLSAGEAGAIAAKAGVGRLCLAHIFPTVDAGKCVMEASEAFGEEVGRVVQGDRIEL